MKYTFLFSFLLLGSVSFANEKVSPEVYCRVIFVENGEREVKDFQLKCDNYGKDTTFESKNKRFTALAFTEESCTPMLAIYDSKTKTSGSSVAKDETNSPLNVFKDRLVIANLNTNVTKDEVLDSGSKNSVVMACSTNKAILEENIE